MRASPEGGWQREPCFVGLLECNHGRPCGELSRSHDHTPEVGSSLHTKQTNLLLSTSTDSYLVHRTREYDSRVVSIMMGSYHIIYTCNRLRLLLLSTASLAVCVRSDRMTNARTTSSVHCPPFVDRAAQTSLFLLGNDALRLSNLSHVRRMARHLQARRSPVLLDSHAGLRQARKARAPRPATDPRVLASRRRERKQQASPPRCPFLHPSSGKFMATT